MAKNSNSLSKIIIGGVVILGVIALFSSSSNKSQNSPSTNNNVQESVNVTPTSNVKGVAVQTCVVDSEKSRVCSDCKKTTLTLNNSDCSTHTKIVDDTFCADLCPKCIQDEEVSRTCSGCNTALLTYKNADCTQGVKTINDSSCNDGCPVVQQEPVAPSYTCNCSKTCAQITSCEEAQYQLNVCGCAKRDGDHDGIACDDMCQ